MCDSLTPCILTSESTSYLTFEAAAVVGVEHGDGSYVTNKHEMVKSIDKTNNQICTVLSPNAPHCPPIVALVSHTVYVFALRINTVSDFLKICN